MVQVPESNAVEVFVLTEVERLKLENLALKRQLLEQQMQALKVEQQHLEIGLRQRLDIQGPMSVDVMAGQVRVMQVPSTINGGG